MLIYSDANVIHMRKLKKNAIVSIDMENETIKIIINELNATEIEFTIEETQIRVAVVGTEIPFQKCGYGRLAFEALKLLSKQYKLPIIVWSLYPAISFYEKIGFLHLNNPQVQNRVIFGNIKDSELHSKVDECDFIYLPQSLNSRKPIIFM